MLDYNTTQHSAYGITRQPHVNNLNTIRESLHLRGVVNAWTIHVFA